MTDQTDKNATLPDLGTRLAIERTRVAYDRTMMAWTRTATSLITFGFTIYKFFQIELRGNAQTERRIGPREFGLAMVSIGLFSLLVAALSNRSDLRALRAIHPNLRRSMATLVAAVISLLGILALVVIILRL
jgi:putative membrane protein